MHLQNYVKIGMFLMVKCYNKKAFSYTLNYSKGATIFFGIEGSWISESNSAIFLWLLYLGIRTFMTPSGATMLKNHATPNARRVEWKTMETPMRAGWKICIFGAISLNKIFIKIHSHPIISWFFVTPLFLMKKNSVIP